MLDKEWHNNDDSDIILAIVLWQWCFILIIKNNFLNYSVCIVESVSQSSAHSSLTTQIVLFRTNHWNLLIIMQADLSWLLALRFQWNSSFNLITLIMGSNSQGPQFESFGKGLGQPLKIKPVRLAGDEEAGYKEKGAKMLWYKYQPSLHRCEQKLAPSCFCILIQT